MWGLAEALYNARTLNGAEGKYLDDLLNLRGVYRNDATATTGTAIVQTNSNAAWTATIPTTSLFTDANNVSYSPTTEQQFREKIYGWSFTKADLISAGTTVTIYIKNVDTSIIASQVFTSNSSSVLTEIATFLQANSSSSDVGSIYTADNTLYLGFDPTTNTFVGLTTPLYLYAEYSFGNKYSGILVECVTTGANVVPIKTLQSMTPTPTGFVSLTNISAFTTGNDVETDVEYITRFNSIVDEATASTKPAIYKALLAVDGVSKVKIYDNPTNIDQVECDTESFNCVIVGGLPVDIAATLATKKPINAATSGTTSYTYSYEDSSQEVIKYTVCNQVPYTVKVSYTTEDGYQLSDAIQSAIKTNLLTLAESFTIGGKIFNTQLQQTVYANTTYGVIADLSVYTKVSSELDSTYTTANIQPNFYSLPILTSDSILFEQVV